MPEISEAVRAELADRIETIKNKIRFVKVRRDAASDQLSSATAELAKCKDLLAGYEALLSD